MVREQSIESFYNKLRESASASASASSTPLLIFPSTSDVDSLCALKIIGMFLNQIWLDMRVSTLKEIRKYAGTSLCSIGDEPITVLLINWGCHRDIKKVLKIGPVARVFVVDSHRPIHLHHLSELNDCVVLTWPMILMFRLLASTSDLASDDEIEDDSDSYNEDESEGEEEDGGETRKKMRVLVESETDPACCFGWLLWL